MAMTINSNLFTSEEERHPPVAMSLEDLIETLQEQLKKIKKPFSHLDPPEIRASVREYAWVHSIDLKYAELVEAGMVKDGVAGTIGPGWSVYVVCVL